MTAQTDRERIYLAIKSQGVATAKEIKEIVCLDSTATNSCIHNLISIGKVFRVGETDRGGKRKFSLFSADNPIVEPRQIPRQTWFSALM